MTAFSQKMVVNENDLPPDLVAKLKQKEQVQAVTQKLETVSEWAGIGKEIGSAVKEGLTAVKDVAVDFSKTDVGTFTMVLIAWKVVGQDVMGLWVGMVVFIICISFLVWSYRRTILTRKVLVKDSGWFQAKEYQMVPPPFEAEDTRTWLQFFHMALMLIIIGISMAIIF